MTPSRRASAGDLELLKWVAEKVDKLDAEVSALRTAVEGRLTVVEQRTVTAPAEMQKLEKRTEKLEGQVSALEQVVASAKGAAWTARVFWSLGGALITGAVWLISFLLHH